MRISASESTGTNATLLLHITRRFASITTLLPRLYQLFNVLTDATTSAFARVTPDSIPPDLGNYMPAHMDRIFRS